MISEGSCEDWSNDENSPLTSPICQNYSPDEMNEQAFCTFIRTGN